MSAHDDNTTMNADDPRVTAWAIGAEDKAMLEKVPGVLPLDQTATVYTAVDTGWDFSCALEIDGHVLRDDFQQSVIFDHPIAAFDQPHAGPQHLSRQAQIGHAQIDVARRGGHCRRPSTPATNSRAR